MYDNNMHGERIKILKWHLKKSRMGNRELHSPGFGLEEEAVSCEHNNKTSDSKKMREVS